MKLMLGAVGKASRGPELDLFTQYQKRIQPNLVLKEVEEKKVLSSAERKSREADLLLGIVPSGAKIVALDERGKLMSSVEFANILGRWRDDSVGDVVFLIGGADGHGERVRERADLVLAFGPMTWPHMMVRALVAEQIYRALAILSNHPYHRA